MWSYRAFAFGSCLAPTQNVKAFFFFSSPRGEGLVHHFCGSGQALASERARWPRPLSTDKGFGSIP